MTYVAPSTCAFLGFPSLDLVAHCLSEIPVGATPKKDLIWIASERPNGLLNRSEQLALILHPVIPGRAWNPDGGLQGMHFSVSCWGGFYL